MTELGKHRCDSEGINGVMCHARPPAAPPLRALPRHHGAHLAIDLLCRKGTNRLSRGLGMLLRLAFLLLLAFLLTQVSQ